MAGSVIQATGTKEFEDGLIYDETLKYGYMIDKEVSAVQARSSVGA